jgi:hypothetical protein
MKGVNCTRCSRPLTYPFTSIVFTEYGKQVSVKNKIPEDVVDGKGVVILYLHGDCKKQGKYSAKMIRKAARKLDEVSYSSYDTVSFQEELHNLKFDVSSRGHRFLKVMPGLMAREVKRLQK